MGEVFDFGTGKKLSEEEIAEINKKKIEVAPISKEEQEAMIREAEKKAESLVPDSK